MNSRRSFLLQAAALGAAGRLRAQQDPFASLPASVWKNARQNGLIMIHKETPSQLSWQTRIVSAKERGDPLVVSGQVFAPDGRTPAAGVTVYAYNTDTEGYYGANRAEYPPRIYGWMKTDVAGRFELRTIHPGRYPQMRVPSHVHFEAWGGGYPIQWVEELQFAGDSYHTPQMLAEDAGRGNFRFIYELRRGPDGIARCSHRIRMKWETTFR